MQGPTSFPRRPSPFGLPALFAAIVAGLGLGLARKPYQPRGPKPAPAADVAADVAETVVESEARPVTVPMPAPVPEHPGVSLLALDLSAPVEPDTGRFAGRPSPTRLGIRILAALQDGAPARKVDVARLVGIGRGSANRMVDRLVASGWLSEEAPGLYRVA